MDSRVSLFEVSNKDTDKRRHDDPQVEATMALADAVNELACAVSQTTIKSILERVENKIDTIMATQSELSADLRAVNAQQLKTAGEIAALQAGQDVLTAKIVELQAIIDAGGTGVTQELIDAVAAVKSQAQIVDDLIPDVPAPPQP